MFDNLNQNKNETKVSVEGKIINNIKNNICRS